MYVFPNKSFQRTRHAPPRSLLRFFLFPFLPSPFLGHFHPTFLTSRRAPLPTDAEHGEKALGPTEDPRILPATTPSTPLASSAALAHAAGLCIF